MIIFIKILSLFLGITVIAKTYIDFKRRHEGLTMLFFWTIAWLLIMYAAIQPGKIYQLMQNFSKDNIGLGTFGGIAFVFLFYLVYRIYTKANRLEQKMHDMVMKLGLKDIEKE